jgi:hypothetical protein
MQRVLIVIDIICIVFAHGIMCVFMSALTTILQIVEIKLELAQIQAAHTLIQQQHTCVCAPSLNLIS